MNSLIFISCICLIIIFGKILVFPIKLIFKLIFNSILGACIIYFINLIGQIWGFGIGINFFTTILVRNFRYTWSYFFNSNKIINLEKELNYLVPFSIT